MNYESPVSFHNGRSSSDVDDDPIPDVIVIHAWEWTAPSEQSDSVAPKTLAEKLKKQAMEQPIEELLMRMTLEVPFRRARHRPYVASPRFVRRSRRSPVTLLDSTIAFAGGPG